MSRCSVCDACGIGNTKITFIHKIHIFHINSTTYVSGINELTDNEIKLMCFKIMGKKKYNVPL